MVNITDIDNAARPSVTLQDIARICNVGKSTVSHALNGDPRVKEETRIRIIAAAERLNYNPVQHQAARRLAMRKYGQAIINQAIGFVSTANNHLANYYITLSQGVLDVLASAGYAMVITPVTGNPMSAFIDFPPLFTSGEIDGAIMTSGSLMELRQIQQVKGFRGRPLVSLIQQLPGVSNVIADDEMGAYLAVRHLLEIGHKYIMIFFDESWGELFQRRTKGIYKAFREFGLDPYRNIMRSPFTILGAISPPYHLDISYLYENDSAIKYSKEQRKGLVDFLREHKEYTALLAQNDAQARRLWYLLQESGFLLPDDVSIIGFDDTDGITDNKGANILTSVNIPLRAIGQEGARLLISRINGDLTEEKDVMLPATLVIRGSTAPVKQ